MKEILKEIYQHCQEMQKLADTKNAGLIALNGAIVLAILKLLLEEELKVYIIYYLYFILICSIIAIFLCLSALSAQLKHKQLELLNYKSDNLLFFGCIANMDPENYLLQLKNRYNLNEEINNYSLDLSKQSIIMSQIALRKFGLFNKAFYLTISGIATPISLIIYLTFFNQNK